MKREGTKRGRKKRKQTFSLALISCWEISFRLFYEESRFVKVQHLSKMYSQYYFIWLKVVTYIILSDPKDLIAKYLYTSSFKYICNMWDPIHLILLLHCPCLLVIFQVWSFFFFSCPQSICLLQFQHRRKLKTFPTTIYFCFLHEYFPGISPETNANSCFLSVLSFPRCWWKCYFHQIYLLYIWELSALS